MGLELRDKKSGKLLANPGTAARVKRAKTHSNKRKTPLPPSGIPGHFPSAQQLANPDFQVRKRKK